MTLLGPTLMAPKTRVRKVTGFAFGAIFLFRTPLRYVHAFRFHFGPVSTWWWWWLVYQNGLPLDGLAIFAVRFVHIWFEIVRRNVVKRRQCDIFLRSHIYIYSWGWIIKWICEPSLGFEEVNVGQRWECDGILVSMYINKCENMSLFILNRYFW